MSLSIPSNISVPLHFCVITHWYRRCGSLDGRAVTCGDAGRRSDAAAAAPARRPIAARSPTWSLISVYRTGMTDAGASTAAFAFAALMGCGSPSQSTFSMDSLLKPEISDFSPKATTNTEESTIWCVVFVKFRWPCFSREVRATRLCTRDLSFRLKTVASRPQSAHEKHAESFAVSLHPASIPGFAGCAS